MGRGRHRGGGGGGRGGSHEDQYGECGISQDRGLPSLGRQGTGSSAMGGTAGSTTRGPTVSYVRQLPKFLQKHAHLLAKAPAEAEQAVIEDTGDDDANDDVHEVAAMARAVAEDPSLLAQYPELQATADKAAALQEKELGNKAFAAKEYAKAVTHYSNAIKLDPTNEVYYSNRAASYQALKKHTEALADAKACVRLAPKWVKGYQRLAAAAWSLDDVSEAVLAYEKALELEPSNQELQVLLSKARHAEEQLVQANKHKFKQRVAEAANTAAQSGKKRKALPGEGHPSAKVAVVKDKRKLSFAAADDEEADEKDQ